METRPHHTSILVQFQCSNLKKKGIISSISSTSINSFMKVEIYKRGRIHVKYTTKLRENDSNPKYQPLKIDIPDDIKEGDYIIHFEVYQRSSVGRYTDFRIGQTYETDLLEVLSLPAFNADLVNNNNIIGDLKLIHIKYFFDKYPMIPIGPRGLLVDIIAESLPQSFLGRPGTERCYLKIYGKWTKLGRWEDELSMYPIPLYTSETSHADPDWKNIVIPLPVKLDAANEKKFRNSSIRIEIYDKKEWNYRAIQTYEFKINVLLEERDVPFRTKKKSNIGVEELIIAVCGFVAPMKYKNKMAIMGKGVK